MKYYEAHLDLNHFGSMEAIKDLSDKHDLNCRIRSICGDDERLFVINEGVGMTSVIVRTKENHDWTSLPDRYLISPPRVREVNLEIEVKDKINFEIVVNPTRSSKNEEGKSIRLALPKEDVPSWLLMKGENLGFKPFIKSVSFAGTRRAKRGKTKHLAYKISGSLFVEDVEKFEAMMTKGFGRAKFIGMGMMMINETSLGKEK